MTHSFVYKMYKKIENIYVNSVLVNIFSNILSVLFNTLVNSKIFIGFTRKENEKNIKDSLIFKLFHKSMDVVKSIFDKMIFINKSIKNSYFVNLFINIVEKRENESIHTMYIVIILSLIINMGIKIITGSFLWQANKVFMMIIVVASIVYVLRLDYNKIFKNSKIIRFVDKIFMDEV